MESFHNMAFVREHRRGDLVYYELVEGYRDSQGRVKQRRVKWYGKDPTPPPEPVQLSGLHFGVLAAQLIDGSLTPTDVFDLLERIGKKPVPLPDLEAVGIRFDFVKKTLQLYWYPKTSASKDPQRAPRAKKSGASRKRASGRA